MPSWIARNADDRESAPLVERGLKPSLSVILVSEGTRLDLERAVRLIAPSIQAVQAQLVIVRRNAESTLDFSLADVGRVEVLRATDDCPRSDMLAMGMRAAQGDIVAVKDDLAVRDADWLSGCRRAVADTMDPRAAAAPGAAPCSDEREHLSMPVSLDPDRGSIDDRAWPGHRTADLTRPLPENIVTASPLPS
jgi:hypothetical protein